MHPDLQYTLLEYIKWTARYSVYYYSTYMSVIYIVCTVKHFTFPVKIKLRLGSLLRIILFIHVKIAWYFSITYQCNTMKMVKKCFAFSWTHYSLGDIGGSEVEVIGGIHPRDDVATAAATRQVCRLAVNLWISFSCLLLGSIKKCYNARNNGNVKIVVLSEMLLLRTQCPNISEIDK